MIPTSDRLAAVLTGISHCYRNEQIDTLQAINLSFREGEPVSLIGPSGAGKSTLLSLLDGRLRGWEGAAVVLDRSLNPQRSPARELRADVGFVFQEFALVERATAYQNVLNGRLGRISTIASLLNRFSQQDHRAAEAALRDAKIENLADKPVEQLSGGQRQRVAIARCLAQEPSLILADEPVSNLDPTQAAQVLQIIAESAERRSATLIFSSHQPALARRFSNRIIALQAGQVTFDGAPEQLNAAQIARIYNARSDKQAKLRLVG